jgi:hypothetical protein
MVVKAGLNLPTPHQEFEAVVLDTYVKAERIILRTHPDLNEKWVQGLISQDTTTLGLGDLVLLQQERIQPTGGRLDLLLQDRETKRRFEVELQLGPTDESHIVRTIEYWDIERRRHPQYDHCAVIIAEEVTSRFLNVIGLFNGSIPLIAIQMQAYRVGEHITLVFTTVLNELTRGLVDEDEAADAAPTDRLYWERKANPNMVKIADQLLVIAKEFDSTLELKFNKFYIGFQRNGRGTAFITFEPKKNTFLFQPKIAQSEELDSQIATEGLEAVGYDRTWGYYKIRLGQDDVNRHREFLKNLIRSAFELRNA